MVRKTRINDLEQIKILMQSIPGFWDKNWRPDVLTLAVKTAKDLSFVYEQDRRILGFVCAHDLGFRAYLSELVVSPTIQRKGIGRILVDRVEKELQKRGCRVLIADVWQEAESFYHKLGWSRPKVILLRKKLTCGIISHKHTTSNR